MSWYIMFFFHVSGEIQRLAINTPNWNTPLKNLYQKATVRDFIHNSRQFIATSAEVTPKGSLVIGFGSRAFQRLTCSDRSLEGLFRHG